jgi:hypothetical protein
MQASARRNQFFALGCLAGLLAGASPAMAFTSFDVLFNSSLPGTSTSNTGVTGKMTFNFAKDTGNQYILDLDIFNTSPVTGNPSGTLVGFALNFPGSNLKPKPDIEFLSYNSLSSKFTETFTNANLGGVGTFSFCARSTDGQNCNGGQPKEGWADGTSTQVQFRLASNLSSVDTADKVAKSFYDLFSTWIPDPDAEDAKGAQVALRFQQVTTSTGTPGASEKVGGLPKPPQGPGDEVPGPLPVLGAATAFGFSRKLRRRIASSTRQNSETV